MGLESLNHNFLTGRVEDLVNWADVAARFERAKTLELL